MMLFDSINYIGNVFILSGVYLKTGNVTDSEEKMLIGGVDLFR